MGLDADESLISDFISCEKVVFCKVLVRSILILTFISHKTSLSGRYLESVSLLLLWFSYNGNEYSLLRKGCVKRLGF